MARRQNGHRFVAKTESITPPETCLVPRQRAPRAALSSALQKSVPPRIVPRDSPAYIGRLAPSPTGFLHLGHARTFALAAERARDAGGRLLMRIDNLDTARCRPEYIKASLEDLAWLGFEWEEPVRPCNRTACRSTRPRSPGCTRPA
ncbi:MAG: glutamate--tRNA ligase family protein [Myxococcales bacterium]